MPVERRVRFGLMACGVVLGVAGGAAAQSAPRQVDVTRPQPLGAIIYGPPGEELRPPSAETGRYWVGVQVAPVEGALAAQLNLADGGLLVEEVVPDAPAAKAGLKQHDVLVSVGETYVRSVPDLVTAVQASEGKEMSLKILRGGKEQTATVMPAERESPRLKVHFVPRDTFIAREVQPYVIRLPEPVDLPEGMKVVVTKEGGSPAEVTVTRGDKTWTAKEGELESLPEEVRHYAARMLGDPVADRLTVRRLPLVGDVRLDVPTLQQIPPDVRWWESPAERKLDDILRRLEAVEKELKEARR